MYYTILATQPTEVKLLLSVPEKQRCQNNNKYLKPSRYLPNPSGINIIKILISVIIIVSCNNNCGGIPLSLYTWVSSGKSFVTSVTWQETSSWLQMPVKCSNFASNVDNLHNMCNQGEKKSNEHETRAKTVQ